VGDGSTSTTTTTTSPIDDGARGYVRHIGGAHFPRRVLHGGRHGRVRRARAPAAPAAAVSTRCQRHWGRRIPPRAAAAARQRPGRHRCALTRRQCRRPITDAAAAIRRGCAVVCQSAAAAWRPATWARAKGAGKGGAGGAKSGRVLWPADAVRRSHPSGCVRRAAKWGECVARGPTAASECTPFVWLVLGGVSCNGGA